MSQARIIRFQRGQLPRLPDELLRAAHGLFQGCAFLLSASSPGQIV